MAKSTEEQVMSIREILQAQYDVLPDGKIKDRVEQALNFKADWPNRNLSIASEVSGNSEDEDDTAIKVRLIVTVSWGNTGTLEADICFAASDFPLLASNVNVNGTIDSEIIAAKGWIKTLESMRSK